MSSSTQRPNDWAKDPMPWQIQAARRATWQSGALNQQPAWQLSNSDPVSMIHAAFMVSAAELSKYADAKVTSNAQVPEPSDCFWKRRKVHTPIENLAMAAQCWLHMSGYRQMELPLTSLMLDGKLLLPWIASGEIGFAQLYSTFIQILNDQTSNILRIDRESMHRMLSPDMEPPDSRIARIARLRQALNGVLPGHD